MTTAVSLLFLGSLRSVLAESYELMVPVGKTVCFEDFATRYSSLIYGFTVYPASSLSDNLDGPFSAVPGKDSGFSEGHRRILPAKPAAKKNRKWDLDADDDLGDGIEDLEKFVDKEWNKPKVSKKKGSKSEAKDGSSGIGIAEEISKAVGSKVASVLATFEIKADNGTILSPKDLKPFTLKKLSVDTDFERIEVCISNVHPTEEVLVGLTWNKHFKSDAPFADTQTPPTKDHSDDVLNKIMGVETTLEHAIKYYETIQILEDHFVSSGNSVLGAVLLVGIVMVFGYLAVGIILRMVIEKSLRYKKII